MRRSAAALLVLIVLTGGALRAAAAWHHERVDFDEGRYLDDAVHILHGRGFMTSTVSLYFEDPPRPPRPEDFSSPLYPFLLAALFKVAGITFAGARLVSLVMSVAVIPLTYLLGKRLSGPPAGLLAAAALALQPDQAIVASWVMTESIYALLLILAILAAAPLIRVTERPPSARLAALLGLLCGLLYLVRQNGAVAAATIAAVLLAGPLAPGERRSRRVYLVTVVAAVAFAVCVPWFARNVSVFGSPTYSRMRNVAWAESGRSLYTPGEPAPSLSRFLAEHGASGVASTLVHRARRVASAFLLAESGPFRWMSILALLAPLIPAARKPSALTLPPAILSAIMFLGVAPWSGALPRYFLPVRPLLYVAGSLVIVAGLRAVLPRIGPSFGSKRALHAAVALAAIAATAWGALSALPTCRDYLDADQSGANRAGIEAAAWIASHTKPDEVLMEGGFLHQYAFLFERGVVWTPYGDFPAIEKVAAHYGVAYLAITPEVLRFRPDLTRHWAVEGRAIRPLALPAGLTPLYERGEEGVLIYRLDTIAAPGSEG